MLKKIWLILIFCILFAFSQDPMIGDDPEISDDEIILDMDDPVTEVEIILEDEGESTESATEDAFNGIMPEQIEFVEAQYDSAQFMQGIEGDVILDLLISDSGSVDSVAVVGSVNPILDSAAVAAARNFKFNPAKVFVEREKGEERREKNDTSFAESQDSSISSLHSSLFDTIPVSVIIQYAYHFSIDEQFSKEIADRINLSGRVFERGSRRPLDNVLVTLVFDGSATSPNPNVPFDKYMETIENFGEQFVEEGALSTLTDSAGRYEFHSIPAGKFTMKIPQAGFEIYEEQDSITAADSLTINPYLAPLTYNDYEIVAYYKGEEKEVARHQLTLNEVKKIPGLSGDAVKVVQALPGVARPTATLGTISVRGTSSEDSRYLLDGTDLMLLYHFGGLKSTYNSEALETIDFYPGGWGVENGDATGGIVSLNSRSPKTDRFHGYLDLSALDMSFLVEGPISKKWSILGTARRSHFGEIVKAVMKARDANGITIAPFYWDYVVRADFKPNDKHHFAFSSFSSNDSLAVIVEDMDAGNDELGSATNAITERMFFNINGINWNFKITDNLTNFATIKSEYDKASFGAMGWARSETIIKGFRYRDNLNWDFSEKAKLNFGIDGFFGIADLEMDTPSGDGTIVRRKVDSWRFARTGVYTNFEIKPIERWLIIPGLRYDYYAELQYDGSVVPELWNYGEKVHKGPSGEPSFRLSTRFAINDKHLLKGAIGTYNQSPKPMGQVIDSVYGNPNLPATKAAHFVAGYEWQITDLISLDVQGYVNSQWNIPRMAEHKDLKNAQSSDDIKMYYSDELGRSRGIEILLRHNQGEKFFGWIAYTLSKSERKTPHTDGWTKYSFDQTHNLQLLASYKLPKHWEIGGRFRYTTGNPTTPIDHIEYDLTNSGVARYNGKPNSERMDPFVQFDFRVEKKWLFKKSALTVYWDIQNLSYFVYKSPEMTLYNDFYTEKEVIAMPIIPSFGVRYDF